MNKTEMLAFGAFESIIQQAQISVKKSEDLLSKQSGSKSTAGNLMVL
jgi:hypothetical protein